MKNNFTKHLLSFLVVLPILILSFGFCFSVAPKVSSADDSSATTISPVTDGVFTFSATPYSRESTVLPCTKKTVTNNIGETVEYNVFSWREISHMTFNFSADLRGSPNTYVNSTFVVGNVQTENLATDDGQMEYVTLFSNKISNNAFSVPNFHFYFDNDSSITETAIRKIGNDFGLYKFEFSYTLVEDGVGHPISIGAMYVAILPDDIDEVVSSIPLSTLGLTYSVSSSNKLMNIYKLTLSMEDEFKYVNPSRLVWTVVGKNRNNIDYVLTPEMKESSIDYSGYHVIWESQMPTEPEGVSFVFDSNNIEGTWIVTCTIYDSEDNVKATVHSESLSTLKAPRKSYLWLIILLGSLLLVGGVVAVIVYKYKNKNAS